VSGTVSARARAAAFVRVHGDPLAVLRIDASCGAATAPRCWSRLREPPPGAPVEAWRPLLGVLDEQRALRSPLMQRACAAIAPALQALAENAEADAACERRLQCLGLLGGYLARSPYVRPEVLDAVGDALAARFTPDLLEGFRWDNLAAYAHFFANAPHEASDGILQWCGRELERGFRTRQFDALRTARVLCLCDAHALPGARVDAAELVLALLTEQGPDGSFGPPGASGEERVENTLAGLVALRFLDGSAGEGLP
jgi:hypothetical protein